MAAISLLSVMPVRMSTLSLSTSFRAFVRACSGFPGESSGRSSSFRPPAVSPISSSASCMPWRCRCPEADRPPDRAVMRPILKGSPAWAAVGVAAGAAVGVAAGCGEVMVVAVGEGAGAPAPGDAEPVGVVESPPHAAMSALTAAPPMAARNCLRLMLRIPSPLFLDALLPLPPLPRKQCRCLLCASSMALLSDSTEAITRRSCTTR